MLDLSIVMLLTIYIYTRIDYINNILTIAIPTLTNHHVAAWPCCFHRLRTCRAQRDCPLPDTSAVGCAMRWRSWGKRWKMWKNHPQMVGKTTSKCWFAEGNHQIWWPWWKRINIWKCHIYVRLHLCDNHQKWWFTHPTRGGLLSINSAVVFRNVSSHQGHKILTNNIQQLPRTGD